MKRLAIKIILTAALAVAGCAGKSGSIPSAKSEALRKILDSTFRLNSVPKEREADLYQILDVFAAGRRRDELVQSVEFNPDGGASLSFSNSGMHGGGVAILMKKDGRWTIDQKYYFM